MGNHRQRGNGAKVGAGRAERADQPPETPAYQARLVNGNDSRTRRQVSLGSESTPMQSTMHFQNNARTLYDAIKRHESNVLAQLRTGTARIDSYLHRTGPVDTRMCDRGKHPRR